MVSMLASGTQDRGFDPGRSRRIFRAKSEPQAKLTGHFSPIIPSFADRGLSCPLRVEAPRGESGNV